MLPGGILDKLFGLRLARAVALASAFTLPRLVLWRVAHFLVLPRRVLCRRAFGRVEGVV